jgi:lysophospholipase L1-like esterase
VRSRGAAARRLSAVLAVVVVTATVSVLGQQPSSAGTATLRWVALGDSYSAGVGGATTGEGTCKREPSVTYAEQARRMLVNEGYSFSYALAACMGATTTDILTGQVAAVSGADIVTLTIGGNDANFGSWIANCLALGRCPGSDSIDWDLIYRRVKQAYVRVRQVMKPTGHLFVLTYPVFFASTDAWGDRQCPRDAPFSHLSALRLNESSVRIGDTIYWAVQDANRELAAQGIPGNTHFVDVRPPVAERFLDGRLRRIAFDPTGICSGVSDAVQTMNGLLSGRGTENTDHFHPTNLGYFGMAARLPGPIRAAFPPAGPPAGGGGQIALSQGAQAPAGYWYSVALSGFTPGARVTVTCRDSVDPAGFYSQTFTIDGAGRAADSTLCYSGDGPDHWVTGGGAESNHVSWSGSPPPTGGGRITLAQGAAASSGYWYSVGLSGFLPGARISVTCRDSVDPGGFWSQTFTIDGAGNAGDSTLCYSGDGPDHWVTGGGVESNHVTWSAPPPPPPARITLAQGGAAPAGYWYSVALSGFAPGSSVTLTCRDSVDPGGFWSQSFTIDGAGNAGDTTLCYSGDGPDHWVTGGGVESNHVTWSAPPPPPPARISLARGGAAPAGYWYSVSLSGFGAGSAVTVTCRDSVDPGGFWSQTFTVDGAGNAGDSTLCYSGDGPDHWVTGGGVESNHVSW